MSHLPLDARAILEYLNELGYRNISAEQLKEFLKDLRKLIKYEERLQINQQQEDYFQKLYKRTTASYRAKVDKENAQQQQQQATTLKSATKARVAEKDLQAAGEGTSIGDKMHYGRCCDMRRTCTRPVHTIPLTGNFCTPTVDANHPPQERRKPEPREKVNKAVLCCAEKFTQCVIQTNKEKKKNTVTVPQERESTGVENVPPPLSIITVQSEMANEQVPDARPSFYPKPRVSHSLHTPSVHTPSVHTPIHTPSIHTLSIQTPSIQTPSNQTSSIHTSSVHTSSIHTSSIHTPFHHTPSIQTPSIHTPSHHTPTIRTPLTSLHNNYPPITHPPSNHSVPSSSLHSYPSYTIYPPPAPEPRHSRAETSEHSERKEEEPKRDSTQRLLIIENVPVIMDNVQKKPDSVPVPREQWKPPPILKPCSDVVGSLFCGCERIGRDMLKTCYSGTQQPSRSTAGCGSCSRPDPIAGGSKQDKFNQPWWARFSSNKTCHGPGFESLNLQGKCPQSKPNKSMRTQQRMKNGACSSGRMAWWDQNLPYGKGRQIKMPKKRENEPKLWCTPRTTDAQSMRLKVDSARSGGTMISRSLTTSRPRKPCYTDPVALYHYYQGEWSHFRRQIPGDSDRAGLRWEIRSKLLDPS